MLKRTNIIAATLGIALLCAGSGTLRHSATAREVGGGGARAVDHNKIVIDGSTTVGPIAKAFAEYFKQTMPEVDITVNESGSGNGAKSLVNSTCDVASMSRFMKSDEFKAAVDKGVYPVAHVVAMDGLAIIVHPSNPIQKISLAQMKEIYLGRIANWSQLGGPDAAIVKISRDTNSGTFETFHGLVMNEEKMSGDVETVGSNGAMRSRVQSTAAAIGYVGVGFLDKTVKAIPVNDVMPSNSTINSGRYPIARPLYLFTSGYPKLGTPLHLFVTTHLSRKGQEMVSSIGFVPVTDYK